MSKKYNKYLRKEQLHGDMIKLRNFMGTFTNVGSIPGNALANDQWLYVGSDVSFSGIFLRNGDQVVKLADGYAELNAANVTARRWEIRRNPSKEEVAFLAHAAEGIIYADEIRPKTLTGEGFGGQTGTVTLNGIEIKQELIDLGTF